MNLENDDIVLLLKTFSRLFLDNKNDFSSQILDGFKKYSENNLRA